MLPAQLLIALICGYRVTGALGRWLATWRVLGTKKTLHGARLTWRIRIKRPLRSAEPHEVRLWLVHPTVPLLFELQVIVIGLLLVAWKLGPGVVWDVVAGPIGLCLLLWSVARASESVLPPCLLYLGVSEPGQYESFRYLASSRAWLGVSAIDQGNLDINQGDSPRGPIGMALDMARSFVPVLKRFRSLPFQRRRLESIRTTDDLWESAVRLFIGFVPLIVLDLRSNSAVVTNELVWVLQSAAVDRLVVVSRPDGTTVLSAMMQRLGMDLRDVARDVVHDDDLNKAVAVILDRADAPSPRPRGAADFARFIGELTGELDRIRSLIQDIDAAGAPSAELDARIQLWAEGIAGGVPPYTSSLWPVVDLIRRRMGKASYSLYVAHGGGSTWAEIGAQPIAQSFRIAVSSFQKTYSHPSQALVVALLRAELGLAVGRGQGRGEPLAPLPEPIREQILPRAIDLIGRFPFLRKTISPGWRDSEAERALATFFEVSTDTFARDDEETTTLELERVIDALQGRGTYVPRHSEYSLGIFVNIDGSGFAEVATREEDFGRRWLVARCGASMRPGVALMLAAIKTEHDLFDGVQNASR